jgi:hypothetical protein
MPIDCTFRFKDSCQAWVHTEQKKIRLFDKEIDLGNFDQVRHPIESQKKRNVLLTIYYGDAGREERNLVAERFIKEFPDADGSRGNYNLETINLIFPQSSGVAVANYWGM